MIRLLILSFILFFLVSCKEDLKLSLKNEITTKHKHVGDGVYLNIPYNFKKKKRAGLYQSKNEASISLQIEHEPIANLRKGFEKKFLKKRQTELLALCEIEHESFDSCFYAKVLDNRKRTIRQSIAFKQNDKTIIVKGFCFEQQKSQYETSIRIALTSLALGEEILEEDKFKLAALQLDKTIFTKDGNYPTESPDQATIEMRSVEISALGLGDRDAKNLINSELKKMGLNTSCQYLNLVTQDGANVFECKTRGEDLNYYFFLINSPNEDEDVLFICSASELENLEEFESYMKAEYIITVLE